MPTTESIRQTRPASRAGPLPGTAKVEIVVPVRNEERDLGPSVRRLHAYLDDAFPCSTRITIADNGSTDGTWAQARALAADLRGVRAVQIDRPGRGGALRSVWSASDADVYAYMDVDLSTDLNALLPLVAPLLSGHSDVAIGTRLARGARVIRGPRARDHLPLLQPAAARHAGHPVLRRAVRVQGDPGGRGAGAAAADHRHRLVLRHRTAGAGRAGRAAHPRGAGGLDRRPRLPGQCGRHRRWPTCAASSGSAPGWPVARSRCRRSVRARRAARDGPPDRPARPGQLARFIVVGVASTVAYVLLYLLLRGAMPAQAANALSLLLTAVANTAVNRRVTFGIRGRQHAARHQVRGLIAFGIGLALTSGALAALHARHGPAGPGRRGGRADRGQPHRHAGPVRSCTGAGCSGAAGGAR